MQKATDAKTLTVAGQEKEIVALAYNSALAKKVSNGDSSAVNASDMNTEFQNERTKATATDGTNNIEINFDSGNSYIIDSNGIIKPSTPKEPSAILKVAENKNKTFDENTELVDGYGNKITVPKGFKIASDSPSVVTSGIIIEDTTYTNTVGSQFVWIPVGKGENAIKKNEEGTETIEIALDRYVFEDDTFAKTGVPTSLSQNFSNETGYHYYAKNNYTEETAHREGSKDNNLNATAKELSVFISSVGSKGGFYIGRYEARTATQRTSSTSNNLTITDSNLTQITENQSDYVYNFVTQLQAAKLSREMYNKDNNNNNITEFASDLMNSYAWDTATLFLQECGEEGYSIKSSVNTNRDGLAEKGTATDQTCNIYDMASNCFEWTTETSIGSNSISNVHRGGNYSDSIAYTSYRLSLTETACDRAYGSFRPILYLK